MSRWPDPTDTIAAVSSAAGRAARAIVRISGPQAFAVLDRLGLAGDDPAPVPRVQLRRLFWPLPFAASPVEITALLWPGPRTATGQDLVELHLPGCPPLAEALLAQVLQAGARLAQPGEFTLRAFLAGKLDLSQVEALAELWQARQPQQLAPVLERLSGGVGQPLHQIRSRLLDLLAEIEASLDFAEEDLSLLKPEELSERLLVVHGQLADLAEQVSARNAGGRCFRVVLTGRPNAGKSSLFNALLGDAAALVAPEPGTTRDWLEQQVCWDGTELVLVDTAGVGTASRDWLDHLAQQAAWATLRDADAILLCVPVDELCPSPGALGKTSPAPVCPDAEPGDGNGGPGVEAPLPAPWADLPESKRLLVATKCDLRPEDVPGLAGRAWPTSAVTGAGLAALRQELVRRAAQQSQAPLAPLCHRSVTQARDQVRAAASYVRQHQPELAALELRLALEALGEVVGAVCTEELLDRIFSQFCIGK
jgi:tRNA modification GTPase